MHMVQCKVPHINNEQYLFFELSSLGILFTELWILFTEFFQSKKNILVLKTNKQKKKPQFSTTAHMFAEAMPGKGNIRNSDNTDRNEFLKVYASLYFLLILLSVKTHPSVVRGTGKPNKAQQPVAGHLCAPKEWTQRQHSTARSPDAEASRETAGVDVCQTACNLWA